MHEKSPNRLRTGDRVEWAALRELMDGGPDRSRAWSDAGKWAIDSLESRLGQRWPETVVAKSPNGTAPELGFAAAHVVAYTTLLERALRLVLVDEVPGRAKLRRVVVRDPRPDQLVHADLQLEIATLALQAGATPELEPGGRKPADVSFTACNGRLVVEARAVLPDEQWRTEQARTDELFARVQCAERACGVRVAGSFERLLDDAEIDDVVARIADHAALVRLGASAPPLRVYGADLRVLGRAAAADQRTGLTGPPATGNTWKRLEERIREKAVQARESGATWLRLDARNGLWQLTTWSQQTLRDKLISVGQLAATALDGLDGLVLSSGSLLRQGDFDNEDVVLEDSAIGLRRLIDPLRIRETLIFSADATQRAAQTWHSLYDSEPGWLAWALDRVGLPGPEAIFAR